MSQSIEEFPMCIPCPRSLDEGWQKYYVIANAGGILVAKAAEAAEDVSEQTPKLTLKQEFVAESLPRIGTEEQQNYISAVKVCAAHIGNGVCSAWRYNSETHNIEMISARP